MEGPTAHSPSTEGDERFGTGGVDGERAVEVGLAGAHPHGDGEALQHFVGTVADDMQAEDAESSVSALSLVRYPRGSGLTREWSDLHAALGVQGALNSWNQSR